MTWRFPRLLNAIEHSLFGGLGSEEAETLRAVLYAPPVAPRAVPDARARTSRSPRTPSPRRRPMTAAQAKAIQANAAGFDREMGIG